MMTGSVEERLDRLEDHYRRRWLRFIPYTILAMGMGIALFLVAQSATSDQLTKERRERLAQDCQSRVEARDVLREVVTQAYTPPRANITPDVQALLDARRDAVLLKVPRLHCVTTDGIPIPVPITSE